MRQAERERKKFQSRIPFLPDPGQKMPKRKSKKIQKHHSGIISFQTVMRQAEKEKKKNLSPEFRSYLTRARKFQKNSKQNSKTSFRHYFNPNRDEISREREKKILVPNSVPSRLGLEYLKKKIAKQFEKFKNIIPALFLSKLG